MTNGNGPPVPIRYHSVIMVNESSEVKVNCSIAGGKYFLWELPNGDHFETNTSSIGKNVSDPEFDLLILVSMIVFQEDFAIATRTNCVRGSLRE